MSLWTFPFRLLIVLILAAVVSVAWLARRQILDLWHSTRVEVAKTPETTGGGRPGVKALNGAQDKIDSLNGWGADSVVLTASELASLIGNGMNAATRSQIDSLRVSLGDGTVEVSGILSTAQIPKDQLGPFGTALNPKEPLAAKGPLSVVGPGVAEWRVDQLRIRNFSLGETVSKRVIQEGLHGTSDGGLRFAIPAGIAGVRVRPSGVTLYRSKA